MQTSFKTITNIPRWRLAAITIGSAFAMSLATTALAAPPNINSGGANGTVGVAFSYQMTANQSIPNGNWGATGLPPGLTGPSATGVISGTPTTAGSYSVHLSATNASNQTGTKDVTFTISNPPAPSLNGNNNQTGTVGVPFSYQIAATNNPTSYNTSPNPPAPGLTVNTTTGAISGTPTTVGNYSVTLSATNAGGTGTKGVTFVINSGPTAIATISPAAVYTGDIVTLDASASYTNPPGGTLIYTWQQIAPSTPNISLSPDNKAVIATFAAPAPPAGANSQAVTFQVKVTDNSVSGGAKNSQSPDVTTTVYALPTANAGLDRAVDQGTPVMLNGSGTGAPPLTYTWTAPAGIALSNIHDPNPTFMAPPFTPPNGTSYTFTLVVTEQRPGFPPKDSAPDQVVIMVKQPPVAYASFVNDINHITSQGTVSESSCTTFTNVTLYGFGVDPDNDLLSFNWMQVHDTGGTPFQTGVDTMATLDDNTSATPSFTAPDLPNGTQQIDLVYQLTVNDGTINSAPSYVTIHVLNTNDPPVAVATASPAPAPEGTPVTLDGSGSSDPNQIQGDTLTYTWTQVGGPGVTLSDVHAVMPTFTAPSVETTLSFVLTVTDHYGCSNQQGVDVTVIQNNHPPLAQAGSDQTVAEDKTACLDGSTSYDKDVGDTLTFHWDQIDGPTVVLDNPDSSQPCFATPNVGPAGATIHFHLTVTDNHGASSTDVSPPNYPTVAVNVTYVNQPPTADAGQDQHVDEGATVHLDGSASSDLDEGNTLSYSWEQVGEPTVVNLTGADTATPTFTAPRVTCAGDVVLMRLTVDDGYGGITTDDVNINVTNTNLPTADAGVNQQAHEADAVALHGTGGDADPEEVGLLTFQWNQTSGPDLGLLGSGKDVNFTAPTIPGGDPNASLDLGFSLTVTDSCGGSTTTDPITVHVANSPHAPVALATGPANANEGGDSVQLDGSTSYDPDADPITYAWTQCGGPAVTLDDPASAKPSFMTPWVSANTLLKFKLTVTDRYRLTNSAYVTVTINNWHTPPDASHASADVSVLWPPDHKMAQVKIIGVTKPSDDKIAISTVTQDEPTNGLGDGDTAIDAVKQVNASGDDSVLLRAERSGNRDGRVYRVCFHIEDPEQDADGCVNVMVPKSKKTDVAIDSGQNYNSTQ